MESQKKSSIIVMVIKTNDELSNLVPLCASCHQKVHAGHAEVGGLVQELGKEPRSGDSYPIQVSESLADELHERKDRGDSYEDVIWRLIEMEDTPNGRENE